MEAFEGLQCPCFKNAIHMVLCFVLCSPQWRFLTLFTSLLVTQFACQFICSARFFPTVATLLVAIPPL